MTTAGISSTGCAQEMKFKNQFQCYPAWIKGGI
jgi:hypothetical protein